MGEKWWEDFTFILSVAKRLGMKIWLLDDKHFPSGFANESIKKYPHLCQKRIATFEVDFYSEGYPLRLLLAAFCFPRKGDGIDYDEGIDVSDDVKNGVVRVCVKKGFYRTLMFWI